MSKTSSRPPARPGTLRGLFRLTYFAGAVWDGVKQDLRNRYVGSVFGTFWAVIFPYGQLAIYTLLYVAIFKIRPSGLSEWEYVLLVFSGLVPLFAFSEMLSLGISSMTSNKQLLMSTVFPAELIPVRTAIAGQLPMSMGMVGVIVLGLILERVSWQAAIFVPVTWILLIMFTVGLSWIFSLITIVAKDLQHGIGLLLMLLIFLSPFAYTPEMVPDSMLAIIYANPMSYFVLTFQDVIVYSKLPEPLHIGVAATLSLSMFWIGYTSFVKGKSVFLDYV